jgi:hypothetical protein
MLHPREICEIIAERILKPDRDRSGETCERSE